MIRTTFALIGFSVLLGSGSIRADIIYTWDDEFTGSTLAGQFTVDPARLLDAGGPGRLLTFEAITSSQFQFSRFSFGNPVDFTITGVSPGGIRIDPVTGAILSDGGELLFGPSNPILVGASEYQVLGGRVQLDINFPLSFGPGVGGGESAFLRDTAHADEFLASSGTWDVQAPDSPMDVPAPPAAILGGVGFLFLGAYRTWVKNGDAAQLRHD
jgi:hypothetical protein